MLWTILLVLPLLWASGFFGGIIAASIDSLIDILLAIAMVVLILQLVRGRRV